MEEKQIAEPGDEFSGQSLPASSAILSEQDQAALKKAVVELEYPGFIARVSDYVATPLELGLKVLPDKGRDAITAISVTPSRMRSTSRC